MKNEEILDSWKAISLYLDRDIRTCYRWEQNLGLPIHRIDSSSSRSKVFAYKSEIDKWLKERAGSKELKKKPLIENRNVIIGLAFVPTLAAIIFAFLFFKNRASIPAFLKNPSIAVLPFENNESSEDDEYLFEGFTNEIIHNISSESKVNVIPAVTASRYQNSLKDTKELGQELNADYILDGKIKKENQKIWIYIELIRTKDNTNIWNEEYEGKLEDIFSFQENICKKINGILNIKTDQKNAPSSSAGKTHNYMAFDHYLKGNFILNSISKNDDEPWKLYHQGKYYLGGYTEENNELAIHLFSKAIDIDRNYAQAYIGLAQCYTNYVNFNWDYKKKWLDKAESLLKTAQTISTDIPEYYSSLIEIYLIKEIGFDENKSDVIALIQEGVKKYPNNSQLNSIVGYYYFFKYGNEGNKKDFDKAVEYKERSFLLNPCGLHNIPFTELLMLKREFPYAIKVCEIIKKQDTTFMVQFRLGEIYYYMGDLDQSENIFLQIKKPWELRISSLFYRAMIASQKGERERTQRIIQEIDILSPGKYSAFEEDLKFASIYMGLEKKELGYQYLHSFFNKLIANKIRYVYYKYIDIDKNFDKCREEEKLKEILKKKEKNNA